MGNIRYKGLDANCSLSHVHCTACHSKTVFDFIAFSQFLDVSRYHLVLARIRLNLRISSSKSVADPTTDDIIEALLDQIVVPRVSNAVEIDPAFAVCIAFGQSYLATEDSTIVVQGTRQGSNNC